MKKLFVVMVALLVVMAGVAYADKTSGGSIDSVIANSNNVKNDNTNTNVNFNDVKAQSNSMSSASSKSSSISGSMSASGAIGQATNDQNVNVEGDETKVSVPPSVTVMGNEGVQGSGFSAPFGGLGFSKTEKYRTYESIIKQIESSSVLTNDQKAAMVLPLYKKMIASVKTQRILGVAWENEGSNILSLVTWGSYWKDGKAQGAEVEKTNKAVVCTESEVAPVEGNKGNFVGGSSK